MNKNLKIPGLLLTILLLVNCTAKNQYLRFAQAGSLYSQAANELLAAARDVGLDSTSEFLLREDATLYTQFKMGVISEEEMKGKMEEIYREHTGINETLIDVVADLRRHIRLLQRYFDYLNKLGEPDWKDEAKDKIGAVVEKLNKIGNQLRGRDFVRNERAFKVGGGIVVSRLVRGMLKKELNARKETIRKELKTQEEMLSALADFIQNSISTRITRQKERLIRRPLLAVEPIPEHKQDRWIENRRAVLTASDTITELGNARAAAAKLRGAFEALVGGKNRAHTESVIDGLIGDLKSFLASVQAIR